MSAARFREAAKVLRERADMATEGHIWHAALGGTVEVCCECGTARKKAPEPDTLAEAGPEPAPRVLICTEREADAQREIRRRVITTYQIEDEPDVLRGCDGADMTTAALVWLEQFVEAVDPDTHPAYTGQPTEGGQGAERAADGRVWVDRADLHYAVTVLDALDPFLDPDNERWLTRLRAALATGTDQ